MHRIGRIGPCRAARCAGRRRSPGRPARGWLPSSTVTSGAVALFVHESAPFRRARAPMAGAPSGCRPACADCQSAIQAVGAGHVDHASRLMPSSASSAAAARTSGTIGPAAASTTRGAASSDAQAPASGSRPAIPAAAARPRPAAPAASENGCWSNCARAEPQIRAQPVVAVEALAQAFAADTTPSRARSTARTAAGWAAPGRSRR